MCRDLGVHIVFFQTADTPHYPMTPFPLRFRLDHVPNQAKCLRTRKYLALSLLI